MFRDITYIILLLPLAMLGVVGVKVSAELTIGAPRIDDAECNYSGNSGNIAG